MAQQQQQKKGNPIFGEKYLQNKDQFPDVAVEFDTVANNHAADMEKLNQQSGQDVSSNLGSGGSGPIVAIHAVVAKAKELSGKPDGITEDAAKAITPVLEKLAKAVQEQRKQDAEAAKNKKGSVSVSVSAGKPRVQWRLDQEPEDPKVTSLEEYINGFHGEYRANREIVFRYLKTKWSDAEWDGTKWDEFVARVKAGITKRELGSITAAHLAEALAHPRTP